MIEDDDIYLVSQKFVSYFWSPSDYVDGYVYEKKNESVSKNVTTAKFIHWDKNAQKII